MADRGASPIIGGALVDSLGWHSVFWINVPIVIVAIVCTARYVPESRAVRARRFDPVGQLLMVLVLGAVAYATIGSSRLGWGSPLIAALFAVAVLALIGLIAYEPRRTDPLLELRLFRSVPFSSAILMAVFAVGGFGAFLFATTLYLQDVRDLSALATGLCLLPVGVMIVLLTPITGRVVGQRGPRLPLMASGTALALGSIGSLWVGPASPLAAVLALYLLFGIALGTSAPPITNTAISGMPRSMAGVAASLASVGRQIGTTLGVAFSGTIVGASIARGGVSFTNAEHGVWWLEIGLGVSVLILGPLSTGSWAMGTAARCAAIFEEMERPEGITPADGATGDREKRLAR